MCVFAGAALAGAGGAAGAAGLNAGLVSLATTAYQVYAQQQQQEAVYELQTRTAEANREAALRDANQSYAQLAERERQERESTEATISSVEEQARRNASLATTSAGEAGVSGNVVAALANDIRRQGITETGRAKRSLEFTTNQLDAERKAVRSRTKSRIASTQLGPKPTIDYFGAALKVGADAYSTYASVRY